MAVVKRGFTVTRTPMGQLFEGATGDLRTVLLNEEGVEAVGGAPYHCAQDAIQYISEVSPDRAGDIWRQDVSAEIKKSLSNARTVISWVASRVASEPSQVCKGLLSFAFHQKPIAVVTFD